MTKLSAINRLRVQQAISHLKMTLVESELDGQLHSLAEASKNVNEVRGAITPAIKQPSGPLKS